MKKWLALLLAFVIPFTSIGGCIAETLRLPKSLKQIEQEAFASAASAEEVDVPFGTEVIGSQAFAGSGLKKIYLPSTVHTIAEDAFDEGELTIVTPDGTYAKKFADEHDFAWEDGSAHYKLDTLGAAKDYWESDEEYSMVLESAEVSLLPTEGITEEGKLAAFNEVNQQLLAYQELAKEYEASIASLTDAFNSLADEVTTAAVDQQDNQLSLSLGGTSYTISGDALDCIGSDYEIVSSEKTEDGSGVITEVTSGGQTYYMIAGASGTVVSSSRDGVLSAQSRIVSRGGTAEALINAVQQFLSDLQAVIVPVDQLIDNALDTAQRVYDQANSTYLFLQDAPVNPFIPQDSLIEAQQRLEAAKIVLDGTRRAKQIWQSLGIAGAISSIATDVTSFIKLNELAAHGHPIYGVAADERRMNMIEEMNDHILSAKWMFACDAALSFLDLLSSIACAVNTIARFTPMGGVVTGLQVLSKVTSVALTMAFAQIVSSASAQAQYDFVFRIDDQLHSFVHGYITDEETDEPIPNVGVTNNSVAVISDENGYYKIHLLPDSHTLTYRVERYEENGVVVSLSPRQELRKDIELKHKEDGATIFGVVTSKSTGELLEGVQVTCADQVVTTGADGSYRIEDLEPDSYEISFYKAGYVRRAETLTLELYQQLEFNMALDTCYIITTREELEAVANDVMGNYTLGNSIDLGGKPWTPLPWFSGTFDGAGYSIDGMQISSTTEDYAGLFVGLYNGHVYNLNMSGVNVDISAQNSFMGIGSICGGLNNGSSLTGCTVTGSVSATSTTGNQNLFVGGLAGFSNSGYITDCFSNVDVKAASYLNAHAGGLVGILNGGQAVDSNAAGNVSLEQIGSIVNANLKAFGTLYSAATLADHCSFSGEVTAKSTNGSANAYGVARSKDSVNMGSVSASTENGSATAIGYHYGENGVNSASVQATASGSGSVTAYGLDSIDVGKNSGSVTARTVSGEALVVGCQSSGNDVTNTGIVIAESVSGTANASGLRSRGSKGAKCTNSASVTATSQTGQALATGVYGCTESLNSGNVSVSSQKGSVIGQGITSCTNSTNSGNVNVTYEGADDQKGSLSAQGLNACNGCTNSGSVTGTVKGSTTACVVTAAYAGSNNVNNGAISAINYSGPANARGVYASNSQNYGTIYAHTSAESHTDNGNATAYGIGSGYSNSFNGGQVTAISEHASAYAYGTGGQSSCSSTGMVSAVSNYFVTGTDENGTDWGEMGNARAYNSTSVQASVAGSSVSASGGNKVNLYYFFAASNCADHHGMSRGFVSFESGKEPDDFDRCFLNCGVADSDAP